MKNGISILMASRYEGNPNFRLPTLLTSLQQQTHDPSSIEVLIKFDDDDKENLHDVIASFSSFTYKIKYFFTSRGNGYLDLHIFYNFLYGHSDRNKNLVMAMADDFIILEKGWEQIVYSSRRSGDLYILHQWLPNLKLPYDRVATEDHRVDEAPIWSRSLIDLWGGLEVCTASDIWTVLVEWVLQEKYNLSITGYLKRTDARFPIIDRQLNKSDFSEKRWNIDRKKILNLCNDCNFNAMVYAAATKINLHYRGMIRLQNKLETMKANCYKYFTRKIGRPIDTSGITIHGTEEMINLIEENYRGYNILVTCGSFYAIAQAEGAFCKDKFNQSGGGYLHKHFKADTLKQIKLHIDGSDSLK